MSEKDTKSGLVIRKERLFSLVFGIVTLVILFTPWYKADVVVMSFPLTLFYEYAGDISGLLGFTKVLAIISVVISCLYIISQIVDVEKIIPGLKKFKFGFYRLFGLVYYGLLTLTALFAIIGSIASDACDPTVRVFFLFVLFGVAVVKFALPKFYNGIVKKIKITIE